MKIKSARCVISGTDDADSGIARNIILPEAVSGMKTFYGEIENGNKQQYRAEEKSLRAIFFTNGEGRLVQDDCIFPVHELTLCIPDMHLEFSITAGRGTLSYLEIAMHLTAQDLNYLSRQQDKFPYHMDYATCRKYKESIKSEKTISRTMLPEGIVPRLCMGSVETTGPDSVAAHTHPMLEQFFYGLKGNDVRVFADSDEAGFLEKDLLHIPPGSRHGVHVEAGKYLHYIWIDLFTTMDDMAYIKRNHMLIDE